MIHIVKDKKNNIIFEINTWFNSMSIDINILNHGIHLMSLSNDYRIAFLGWSRDTQVIKDHLGHLNTPEKKDVYLKAHLKTCKNFDLVYESIN